MPTVDSRQDQLRRTSRSRDRASYRRRRLVALMVFVCVVAAALGVWLGLGRGAESEGTVPASAAVSSSVSWASTSGTGSDTSLPSTGDTGSPASSAGPSSTLPGPVTAAQAREVGANELGRIPVLMYHLIGTGKNYLTPDQLRFHIALLRSHGFYPTTVREMVEGTMEIPAGKSPVVLTFDDSSPGQFRILSDGAIDPDCAVGILQAETERGAWAFKATFFPLLEVNGANILFGQPEVAQRKLRDLVEWGCEVGSHGLSHLDLSKATRAQIRRELAKSKAKLESLVGNGYQVFTLSPPYGEYPSDVSLLLSGDYEGQSYTYGAVVMAWGENCPSPFSDKFDHVHIPRITAAAPESVKKLLKYWNAHRELLYISDGDPNTVSFPRDAPPELGRLRPDVGRRVVEY